MPLKYRAPAENPDKKYPFIFTTDRSLFHFHTGTMTRKVEGLDALNAQELLNMNSRDAKRLGVKDGSLVHVISRRGKIKVQARLTDICPPGVASMTFHFAETPTNELTNSALDPVAKIPETKVYAVRIERVNEKKGEKLKKRYRDMACAIFAGGQNKRMGTHKAFLQLRGKTFIETISGYASERFGETFIVTNDRKLFPGFKMPVFEDIIPGKGPMAALHTALTLTKKERVFCLACDMPFLHSSVMDKVIRSSEAVGFDCFVPRGISGPEPLFAIYRTTVKNLIKDQIESGRLRLSDMLEKCRTLYVDIDNREGELININTPREYGQYAGKM